MKFGDKSEQNAQPQASSKEQMKIFAINTTKDFRQFASRFVYNPFSLAFTCANMCIFMGLFLKKRSCFFINVKGLSAFPRYIVESHRYIWLDNTAVGIETQEIKAKQTNIYKLMSNDNEEMVIKLAGVKDITRAGWFSINRLVGHRQIKAIVNSKDSKHISLWVFYRPKYSIFKKSLNAYLAKNGECRSTPIGINPEYEEKIDFLYKEVKENELYAKINERGLWSEYQSELMRGKRLDWISTKKEKWLNWLYLKLKFNS